MIYEEKLEKILFKLGNERNLTRKNHKTRVTFDDRSFTKVRIGDICKILLQLQDDAGVVEIVDALQPTETIPTEKIISPSDDDDYEGVEIIIVELDERFDSWYQKYLEKQALAQFKQSTTSPKYARQALEKIWNVLQEIEEKRLITAEGDDVAIPQVNWVEGMSLTEIDKMSDERFNILRKLEGERVLKDLRWPHDANNFAYFKKGDSYEVVFEKYKQEYKEAAKDYQQQKVVEQEEQNKKSSNTKGNATYILKRTVDGIILLIGVLEVKISKPRINSINDNVFNHLLKNPNRFVKKSELKEKACSGEMPKDLHKTLENLGFKGSLRDAFFKVSSSEILLRNPVTQKQLEELGIDKIKLQ